MRLPVSRFACHPEIWIWSAAFLTTLSLPAYLILILIRPLPQLLLFASVTPAFPLTCLSSSFPEWPVIFGRIGGCGPVTGIVADAGDCDCCHAAGPGIGIDATSGVRIVHQVSDCVTIGT